MIVENYSEHIAYTYECEESVFKLGMKILDNMNMYGAVQGTEVIYNEKKKLLFGHGGFKPMSEAVHNASAAEIIYALKDFLNKIMLITENDYLNIEAVDVNFNRLYYDEGKQTIMFFVLPINGKCDFHDGCDWSSQLRNTLLIISDSVMDNTSSSYQDIYYNVSDKNVSDMNVMKYLYGYDFGIMLVGENDNRDGNYEKKNLILEHKSENGNLLFKVDKPEYIFGKSKEGADGVISLSGMVSRKHCAIFCTDGNYIVQDLESTNGTKINGYELKPLQSYYINNGDILSIADVDFNVIIE